MTRGIIEKAYVEPAAFIHAVGKMTENRYNDVMAEKILCDFCLREIKGLFKRSKKFDETHYICNECRETILAHNLPLAYGLMQILVTAEPRMREMIMTDYLENHSVDAVKAEFFPDEGVALHKGEHLVNKRPATIRVQKAMIPEKKAVTSIPAITRNDVMNLSDAVGNSGWQDVEGTLYETNAALYFLSSNLINVHRLTSLVKTQTDADAIRVLEHNRSFTYHTPHTDLFFMRETLYRLITAAAHHKKSNLIYLTSDNTMTLTPGIYNVPHNIRPGVYWVSPVNQASLSVRDAAGHIHDVRSGRLQVDAGSMLEVTGEYRFRLNNPDDHS